MLAKLDDFELVRVIQGETANNISDLRTIRGIRVVDSRNIVELNIPGSLGNVLQDMGREPVTILIFGEFAGPDAKASLESLMSKYISDNNKPMQFSSDMTTAIPEITKVMLDQFQFEEIAGHSHSYRYYMKLVEYREPRPQQEEKAPEQDVESDLEKESEIDDIRGQVLDSEDSPLVGVKVKIKGPDKESEVNTDEQGYYEILDVGEGKYEVTTDEESYEEEKEVVEVKKGENKESETEP